ncbi:hypothetical protein ACJZ2D_003457 [Fusarium nematophilum]
MGGNRTANNSPMRELIRSLGRTTLTRPSPSPWRAKGWGYFVPLLQGSTQPDPRPSPEPVPSEGQADPLAERLPSRSRRWRRKVKRRAARFASRTARRRGPRSGQVGQTHQNQVNQVCQHETTAAASSFQDQGTPARLRRKPQTTFKLLQLPEELLLEIMGHLPHGSVYMLHQTCRPAQDHRHLRETDFPLAKPSGSISSIRLPVYRTFYWLRLDHDSHISMGDIRQGLRGVARAGLPSSQQLCKHVSAGSD